MLPPPESSSRWLGIIMPVLREGGPVVALVLLLVGTVSTWWLARALEQSRAVNVALYERLLACTAKAGELEWKYRAPAQP